jgi:hypothetical protein
MSNELRDFNDPRYKKWRKAVYARDKFKCKMPGCTNQGSLNAHHIKRWADFPSLRFVVSNGITLCRSCHERIQGNEEQYEPTFTRLVVANGVDDAAALTFMFLKYKRTPDSGS